jgi:anti-sigma regulatory factor (Ser/Thr protein kinase)
VPDDWSLSSNLGPLGALPTAPSLARGFATSVLESWGLSVLGDTAELIASELATNVVQAATDEDGKPRYDESGNLPLVWLRLLSDRMHVLIEVWDNIPDALGAPAIRHAEELDESGRGLEIVDTLSDEWGWENVQGWNGKRVWALLVPPE